MTTQNSDWSGNTGSQEIGNGVPNPNNLGAGQTSAANAAIDPTQHAELEKLVGRQGEELGEFRKFFSDIAPLLDKLDKSPEIVQAIIDGNITQDLAKAAMEGKISIGDAKIVVKAQEEVKKDLGNAGFSNASAEEVNRLVEAKALEIQKNFDAKFKERDELTAFESSVNDFIARTTDFPQYAAEIDKWLDAHDVTDIAVAYYAVKGELSVREANKQANIDKAEAEKAMAMNPGGGVASNSRVRVSEDYADGLIASKSNPNVF